MIGGHVICLVFWLELLQLGYLKLVGLIKSSYHQFRCHPINCIIYKDGFVVNKKKIKIKKKNR